MEVKPELVIYKHETKAREAELVDLPSDIAGEGLRYAVSQISSHQCSMVVLRNRFGTR